MKKLLATIIGLLLPVTALAINVTIPQSTAYGQIPIGNANGTYTPTATSTWWWITGGSSFAYPFPNNATSSTLSFLGGIISSASSTFTSATTTFTGDIFMDSHTSQLVAHNIRAHASDGLFIKSVNGSNVAMFGAGGGQNATFYNGTTITGLLSANGGFSFTSATGTSVMTLASSTIQIANITNLNFGGVSGTAWSTFCTSITGGAGLCDGTDDTGGGVSFAYPFTSATTYTGVSTSTLINFAGGLMSTASSTLQTLNSSNICLGGVCNTTWPSGSSQWTTLGSAIYYANNVVVGSATTSDENAKLTVSTSTSFTHGLNDVIMRIVGASGAPARMELVTSNGSTNGSFINFVRTAGTLSSPTAVTNGMVIAGIGTSAFGATRVNNNLGFYAIKSLGTHTDTQAPTYHEWYVTATTSVTAKLRMSLDSDGHIISAYERGTTTKSQYIDEPIGIASITAANYLATYSDDPSRMIMMGTAAGANIHIRNGGFAQASQLYIGTTAQTITHTTIFNSLIVGRGAVTYQGYHYILHASTTNATFTVIRRATSSDGIDISLKKAWATSTISGIPLVTGAFLVGAAKDSLWVATTTTGVQAYRIATTTNTLTSTYYVHLTGANVLINNTRVNDEGIYVGFNAAPFTRKYNFSGSAWNGTNIGVAVPGTTGPDMFVMQHSLYGLYGNSTTFLSKVFGY